MRKPASRGCFEGGILGAIVADSPRKSSDPDDTEECGQRGHVVHRAEQRPLSTHILKTSSKEAAEPPGLLDLAKYRLHRVLA